MFFTLYIHVYLFMHLLIYNKLYIKDTLILGDMNIIKLAKIKIIKTGKQVGFSCGGPPPPPKTQIFP